MHRPDPLAGGNRCGDHQDNTCFRVTPPPREAAWNWSDVAPSDLALRQRAWDRTQLVLHIIDLHFTVAEIGSRLGITGARVMVLASRAKGRD